MADATLLAYRHGHFDPAQEPRLLHEARTRRGLYVDRETFVFSDRTHSVAERPQATESDSAPPVVRWTGVQERRTAPPLAMSARFDQDRLLVRALADLSVIPDREVERLLTGIETLCATAVDEDFPLAEVAALTGMPLVHRDPRDWIVTDHSHVSLPESAALMNSLDMVEECVLHVESDASAPQIVARLIPTRSPVALRAIHAAAVAALEHFPHAAVPHRYVLETSSLSHAEGAQP